MDLRARVTGIGALADDTRFRLYRYLGLSGRAVSVRELSTRLSLHPNTLRPHLRRLEELLADVQDELLAPLSAAERQQLTRLLTQILEHHA